MRICKHYAEVHLVRVLDNEIHNQLVVARSHSSAQSCWSAVVRGVLNPSCQIPNISETASLIEIKLAGNDSAIIGLCGDALDIRYS